MGSVEHRFIRRVCYCDKKLSDSGGAWHVQLTLKTVLNRLHEFIRLVFKISYFQRLEL